MNHSRPRRLSFDPTPTAPARRLNLQEEPVSKKLAAAKAAVVAAAFAVVVAAPIIASKVLEHLDGKKWM